MEFRLLGICVGLQWMIESSQEAPDVAGLGLWPGDCERFPANVKSPHVGWNQLAIRNGSSRLLRGIPSESFVYFTHSFRVPLLTFTVAECKNNCLAGSPRPSNRTISLECSFIRKSGAVGLKVLENFLWVATECICGKVLPELEILLCVIAPLCGAITSLRMTIRLS